MHCLYDVIDLAEVPVEFIHTRGSSSNRLPLNVSGWTTTNVLRSLQQMYYWAISWINQEPSWRFSMPDAGWRNRQWRWTESYLYQRRKWGSFGTPRNKEPASHIHGIRRSENGRQNLRDIKASLVGCAMYIWKVRQTGLRRACLSQRAKCVHSNLIEFFWHLRVSTSRT
jgi:hypothetical protein